VAKLCRSVCGINSAVAALRFFFTVTLDRPDLARRLTLGGCMPICVWCSWKRRRSSPVAVSGERPMKAANARTLRT
jgi:hypothetical protein